ncbi:MAG TPA: glycosyltransferase family 39 protein, partial [Streptosporangiaceae bacterium]|nr:glycosyltransferase family 39 protein [Streptosporangiaceae bacterium]
PSVIAMAVAAVLIVIIGRRRTGSGWAGLFAGLIMALTPSISFYAQTARSYALVFACVLGATLALIHAMEAEAGGGTGGRRWVVYGGLVTLGGYLNEMSLLVLAAHALTVWLARCGRSAFRRWASAAAVAAALVAPVVLVSLVQHDAIGWISRPGLADIRVLFQDYFAATPDAAVLLILCAAIALAPPAGTWRWLPGGTAQAGTAQARTAQAGTAQAGTAQAGTAPEPPWWSSGGVSLPSVGAPLLVLPAAILMLESRVAFPAYVDRYVLYGEAGAALLAAGGVYRIGQWLRQASGRRALLWVPGVIVCLCVLVMQLVPQHHARRPGSRRYDYGGPSRYVGANARPGDGILFFGKFYRKAKLGYPGDFTDTGDFAQAASPLQVGNFQGRDKPADVTLPLMLGYRRIWVFGARPSLRRPEAVLRAESAVLLRRYTLIAQRQFHGILVTLWQRR